MDYLTLKWLHVVSATILFGTGIGSAFYLFTTNLGGDVRAIAAVARRVVAADWLFTTPAAIVQPVTGIALARAAGFPLDAPWLAWSIGLYAFALACWLPVVVIQLRMARLARQAERAAAVLPKAFWHYHVAWTALGVAAFVAFNAIFYLMVVKPG